MCTYKGSHLLACYKLQCAWRPVWGSVFQDGHLRNFNADGEAAVNMSTQKRTNLHNIMKVYKLHWCIQMSLNAVGTEPNAKTMSKG